MNRARSRFWKIRFPVAEREDVVVLHQVSRRYAAKIDDSFSHGRRLGFGDINAYIQSKHRRDFQQDIQRGVALSGFHIGNGMDGKTAQTSQFGLGHAQRFPSELNELRHLLKIHKNE